MTMFDCAHCGDRHHVNDFCASGPMSADPAANYWHMTTPPDETGSVGTETRERRSAPSLYPEADTTAGVGESQAVAIIRSLIAGWEVVEPEVNNLFVIQQARTGLHYDGPPDFAIALNEARAFLAALSPLDGGKP